DAVPGHLVVGGLWLRERALEEEPQTPQPPRHRARIVAPSPPHHPKWRRGGRASLQQPLEALHVARSLEEELPCGDRDDRVTGRGAGRGVPGLDGEPETLPV